MKEKLNRNKVGLVIGLFIAVLHALWAVIVAIMPSALQKSLDWIFTVHFLSPIFILTAFSFMNAIFLIILAFVAGYIFGWLFAAFWNWVK